jgi:hypothetical protein
MQHSLLLAAPESRHIATSAKAAEHSNENVDFGQLYNPKDSLDQFNRDKYDALNTDRTEHFGAWLCEHMQTQFNY